MVQAVGPVDSSPSQSSAELSHPISRAALQRHEEAVFEIDRNGNLGALNPLADGLLAKLGILVRKMMMLNL